MSDTDRIEKQIVLEAPRSRVWRAITSPEEFGRWFGADVRGPFAAGALEAFRGNKGGRDQQAENIARHVRESP